ncbi:MAG: hypothetical protein MUF51_09395, partial [Vicinamibacteria bacterium]|nr:hypothetical protein [Vicinamibacteria bacterium]
MRESEVRQSLAAGLVLALFVVIGAFPQMAAWKCLYNEWLLPYPPHGTDFLRLDHPFAMNTLFSMRHGLLSWTPIFWAAYLGFLPFTRRHPTLAAPLLIPLVLMTYVNFCSGDWWAGGSFSNRRFDGLLVIFAFGIAAALDWLGRACARRPQVALVVLMLPCIVWQATHTLTYIDDPLAAATRRSFPARVQAQTQTFVAHAGSPPTWPASWFFAWRFQRPAMQYDLLVGRYLFYRQNNMNGHIELGAVRDEVMLGEGWGPSEQRDRVDFRRVAGAARLFAPLDIAQPMEIRLRVLAEQPASAAIRVNGREVGRIQPATEWVDCRVVADASYWQRELNEITIHMESGEMQVDSVDFVRVEKKR